VESTANTTARRTTASRICSSEEGFRDLIRTEGAGAAALAVAVPVCGFKVRLPDQTRDFSRSGGGAHRGSLVFNRRACKSPTAKCRAREACFALFGGEELTTTKKLSKQELSPGQRRFLVYFLTLGNYLVAMRVPRDWPNGKTFHGLKDIELPALESCRTLSWYCGQRFGNARPIVNSCINNHEVNRPGGRLRAVVSLAAALEIEPQTKLHHARVSQQSIEVAKRALRVQCRNGA
jgi:hypothetical protein